MNTNPNQTLFLLKQIEDLKYKLKQFQTLLGICPFDREELKGDQGPQGDQGIQGPQGPQGSPGATVDISGKAEKTASNLSAGNILSWQEVLQINDLQNTLADEITALQNADTNEVNARTFADGILDGKITTEKNRNDAQDAEINLLKIKPQLISTDDSILIEENDIGAMLSFFYEEFSNQNILLSFTPVVILGVYKNGLLLNDDEFILVLPKNILINNYTTNDKIKIQYQHLKTDLYEYNIPN